MQHLTAELAEDLDALRTADDFHDAALPILVHALKQGTAVFSEADMRRVVVEGSAGKGKGDGELR
jgi:ribosome assembly protein 3